MDWVEIYCIGFLVGTVLFMWTDKSGELFTNKSKSFLLTFMILSMPVIGRVFRLW